MHASRGTGGINNIISKYIFLHIIVIFVIKYLKDKNMIKKINIKKPIIVVAKEIMVIP